MASCLMIGLAIFAFLRLEVDKVNFSFPEVSFSSFYLYIGGLVFILLGIDHWIRQLYKKKQQDEPI
ncbi:MAG: hypothetical protein LUG51_02535 [Tannerellaceae bacterium]|nr:hypothetical protein [Tannerellaceae bacterium]